MKREVTNLALLLSITIQNVVVESDQEMCEEFCKFYGSVFTKEKLGHIPEATQEYNSNLCGLCDIEITEEKIINKRITFRIRQLDH